MLDKIQLDDPLWEKLGSENIEPCTQKLLRDFSDGRGYIFGISGQDI